MDPKFFRKYADMITEAEGRVLYMNAVFDDEYSDGGRYVVRGVPQLIKTFVSIANEIEDLSLKGTAYAVLRDEGNGAHWHIDSDNYTELTPINNTVISAMTTLLSKSTQNESIADDFAALLEDLGEKGFLLMTDGSDD